MLLFLTLVEEQMWCSLWAVYVCREISSVVCSVAEALLQPICWRLVVVGQRTYSVAVDFVVVSTVVEAVVMLRSCT